MREIAQACEDLTKEQRAKTKLSPVAKFLKNLDKFERESRESAGDYIVA